MTEGKGWGARVRAKLLAGLVVTVPAVMTLLALRFLFRSVDSILGPPLARLIGMEVPGLGLLATVVLVFLVGVFAANYAGRRTIALAEKVFTELPFVRRIYGASKEIVESATLTRRQVFRDVVQIQHPRLGVWSYGFVTSYVIRREPAGGVRMANVFVPTPPVPTSGILVTVAIEELRYLDLSVEDALKLVLSAGLASPDEIRWRPAPSGDDPPADGRTTPR
jgi:uncharacterized membrane protein